MFLVTHDESTDAVQAFAEDTAHLYAPAYVGIIDYAVRVDVPECFVLDGETYSGAQGRVDAWRGEPGSAADRGEPIYNRESYFRG